MCKKFVILFAIDVIFLISTPTSARLTCNCYSLNQQIDTLITKTIPSAHPGIIVLDADSGKMLYQKNSQQYFTPASTTKLFTAAAALYQLTPNFRYTTTLHSNQQPAKHTLHGNLYIKFSGDPSLTSKHLFSIIHSLKKKNIQKIAGHVILDTHAFEGPKYPEGFVLDDRQWGYGAPTTSVIINRNSLFLSIMPSTTIGKPATLLLSKPQNVYFKLKGTPTTVTQSYAQNRCSFSLTTIKPDKINVKGCWPAGVPTNKRVAIQYPTQYATYLIRTALQSAHITLDGRIEQGRMPKKSVVLAKHTSSKLSALVTHLLVYSDNLYANAILKTLGLFYNQKGDFLNGVLALKTTLSKHTDIDFDQMMLFDGAGMSIYNRIKPYQIAQLLYTTYHNSKIKSAFVHALAQPNHNGTLSERMHTPGLNKQVRAKTGTLKNTSSLAGYLKTANNRTLCFVIIINNYSGNTDTLKN